MTATRRALAGALTVLAAVGVWAALAAPRQAEQLTAGALVRIPVEALVGLALLLVLPGRARRWFAVAGGALVGVLALLRVLDMGFRSVLDRPFDLVLDWVLLGNAREFLDAAYGPAGAVAAAVIAVVVAVAVVVLAALGTARLGRLVDRHRTAAGRTLVALSAAWLACAALGAQVVAPVPVAARSATSLALEKTLQVPASIRDERQFAAESAADAVRTTPGAELLAGLRGKDVMLTFVESYGRSALDDPRIAPAVTPALDAGAAQLAAAGFSARSGWLTSPTFGGGSWLAHSTLESGLRIGNQERYRSLVASDRTTLSSAFRRAGWETTGVMPATWHAWPESRFFGIDRVHGFDQMGYRGPNFGFSPMPDQYTLAQFERLERGRTDRGSLFAQVELTSSHVPYSPLPAPVAWETLGDGAQFGPQTQGQVPPDAVLNDGDLARTQYARAASYSLSTLFDYVQRHGDDRLVLVFLGDHQPQKLITGEGEGVTHDVPITIVAKDPAVLDRVAGWGWDAGLRPGPQAPVWPMEAFRDRFLTAFAQQDPPRPA